MTERTLPTRLPAVMYPAIAFVLGLGLLELALLDVPYKEVAWSLITRQFGRAGIPILLSLFGLAGLVLFVTLARNSSGPTRLAAFCLSSACLLYEYSYQDTLGRFSNADDIVVAYFVTNAEHKLDAVTTYVSALPMAAILGLGLTLWSPRGARAQVRGVHWAIFAATGALWALGAWFAAVAFPILSIPNTLRSVASFCLMELTTYRGPREAVATMPVRTPARNLVFVVDEAVDGGHLSANGYARPTTPYLQELVVSGRMQTWGEAVAGSTCSHASGVLMYTGLQIAELPDRGDMARRLPNLFQWAKAAGYRTHFLDGQMTSYWIGPVRDLADVDEWHPASEFGTGSDTAYLVDLNIAKLTKRLLESADRQFIFIWKAGLHYPYYRRFPSDSAPWRPFWAERTIHPDQTESLVNAYDNGILWSTDGFFRELMAPTAGLPQGSVLLYTSDHGQSLGRSGLTATHCGTSPSEVVVPLMLFGSGKALDESYRASHGNVFATLIDLMGFDPPGRYGRSLLRVDASDSVQRFFFGPDLASGHPFPFDKAGIAPRSANGSAQTPEVQASLGMQVSAPAGSKAGQYRHPN